MDYDPCTFCKSSFSSPEANRYESSRKRPIKSHRTRCLGQRSTLHHHLRQRHRLRMRNTERNSLYANLSRNLLRHSI